MPLTYHKERISTKGVLFITECGMLFFKQFSGSFMLDQMIKLLHSFQDIYGVSYRLIGGFFTALVFSLIGGALFLRFAHLFRSAVREYTPDTHQLKNNTPTMGGLFVVLATVGASLLWCDLTRPEGALFLGCLVGFGLIGLWDDLSKLYYKKGIRESHKFLAQIFIGVCVIVSWYVLIVPPTQVSIPFFKALMPLGLLVIPWAVFIVVGASNAVNLTDGLDGLAIGSLITTFGTFALICFVAGNYSLATFLSIPYTATSEIAIIGGILTGASLGFLWYNMYPAQLFMGDVGSLSLGSALALMAIMARQELLLPVAGGLFVLETLSVMVQVIFYKLFKKRVFKRAPLHHHFELQGWHEAIITTRCSIITLVLCLLSLCLFFIH